MGESLSHDSFSGKFGEIWAKYLCTPKKLPAPIPMPQIPSFQTFAASGHSPRGIFQSVAPYEIKTSSFKIRCLHSFVQNL